MGTVPPNLIPPRRTPQPKDEHPMTQEWEQVVHGPPQGGSCITPVSEGGQSNRALLALMGKLEERIASDAIVRERLAKIALVSPGENLQFTREHVQRMVQLGVAYSEWYAAPVAPMAEILGITPRPLPISPYTRLPCDPDQIRTIKR